MSFCMVDPDGWDDGYMLSLKPQEKLMFWYLAFGPETFSSYGVPELSETLAPIRTGLTWKRINEIVDKFHTDGKVERWGKYIWVKNHIRYRRLDGKNMRGAVNAIRRKLGPEMAERVERYNSEGGLTPFEDSQPPPLKQNRTEQNRTEQNTTTTAPSMTPAQAAALEVLKTIPEWPTHEKAADRNERDAQMFATIARYTAVDLEHEAQKMKTWLQSQPKQQRRLRPQFTNWIEKAASRLPNEGRAMFDNLEDA